MTAAAWAGKPALSHIRTNIELIVQGKTVVDGDDAIDDADQHGTAAGRRPRQRRGPDESRVRLFGIIMICMMRRW